jgi:uncharacterized ion transporter superfamily protein YfcC
MDEKAGAQISRKAFIQSFIILLVLMILAGVMTLVIPGGSFTRMEQAGRVTIVPGSYVPGAKPIYPIWRWVLAPLEVLGGSDSLTIITIIIFILLVGGAFAVLDKCGILNSVISKVVKTFGKRKYILLLVVSFFFMVIGAFFGIFEEVVPLIPLMIALAIFMGWDTLVGLGMSILATNMGFSAALTNPFTIGVAQKLAGLPLFSGFLYRIPIFLGMYAVEAVFLLWYAKRIDRNPEKSLTYKEDEVLRGKQKNFHLAADPSLHLGRASVWFGVSILLIIVVLVSTQFVTFLANYSLPIVGILFFAGGLGAGFMSGAKSKTVWKALWEGITGILPGVPLILMAASVKYIVNTGGIMDTILYKATGVLSGANPITATFLIFLVALIMEIFISSGSAKAFLLIPILIPLADLVGVTHQITVLAYCFGDGFSNMAYPTNAVLLISLGLANVSYGKWMKFTWKLWVGVAVLVLFFLWLAVKIHFGPF